MLNKLFETILNGSITPSIFAICTIASIVVGLIIAFSHMFRNTTSKSFAMTLATLPLIIQIIIMLVNGNLGTGIAVAGAFSLVRFRSVPGSAREILSIFTAMAAGLATGVGYIGVAIIFTLLITVMNIFYTIVPLGKMPSKSRELKITIPESLNYTDVFEDLFAKYTTEHTLKMVKTSNMGSLYQLTYSIMLKDIQDEKTLIDQIRCRNGNLDIIINYSPTAAQEL